MARFRLPAIAMMLLIGADFVGGPAVAQFDSIFGAPPRPPGSVPRGQQGAPPPQQPQQRGVAPADVGRGDVRSGVTVDGWRNPDAPPDQPIPAPMNLPPSSRPGRSGIESGDLLAPPGGGAPAELSPNTPLSPQPPAGQQPLNNAATNPAQTLPGLPPGVRQPPGTPQQPGDTSPQPGDEIVVEPPPQRIANPTAVFSGLDKITGRIITFDVAINETVQFGALQVTPRVCYSRPPTETQNTDAFTQVDEVTLSGEVKRIFSGWMFAASPGLHAVEHPTYDVWLTECKGGQNPSVAEAADAKKQASPPPTTTQQRPAPQQPRPPAQPRPQQQQPQFQPGTLLPPLR